ncbi:MAG: radical SAM protein [Nitrososphaerota archaeon]|nr:radical SAM protein [Nitrososphaerota archaeon]
MQASTAEDEEGFTTTKSLCPVCLKLVDATLVVRANKVIMEKACEEHGPFQVLISSDADYYRWALRFNKPGTVPKAFGTETNLGCPYDCGLCPEHQQHTCLGIIEVTEKCNMRCPTCFSDSGVGKSLELGQVESMLDSFVRYEGNPEVVQFSGGEPSVHPQILDMIRAARARNIKLVMLNSNGIRIARDEVFVRALAEMNVTVYLQFDGFRRNTYEILRGEDATGTKRAALENLSKYGVSTVLACTVQRKVNEDEYGAIADYAFRNPHVKGVVFQPTFYTGRHPDFDPLDRVTLPDVIKGVVAQSDYGLLQSDFFPIPCCYPNCSTATYVYVEDGKATPLTRVIDHEDYMDYFSNRALPDTEYFTKRTNLESLYSAAAIPGSDKVLANYCSACDSQLSLGELADKVKMILVQPFMDAWNFDLRRVAKCCVGELTPAGKIIPFCAFNTLYRGGGP